MWGKKCKWWDWCEKRPNNNTLEEWFVNTKINMQ